METHFKSSIICRFHSHIDGNRVCNSYFQVITIMLYTICGIILFSELTGKEPYGLLTALGAASAIVILVFKDTILGFVASI